jgi:hypothetical protein
VGCVFSFLRHIEMRQHGLRLRIIRIPQIAVSAIYVNIPIQVLEFFLASGQCLP